MKMREVVSLFAGLHDFRDWEWDYYRKRIRNRYYVIRRTAGGAGFFSNYMWVLGHVIFARKLGYIPVVDMENYPTLYSEDEGVDGERNAWNYYFENVSAASLKEAYESGKYVLGLDEPLHRYEGKYCIGDYRFPTRRAIAYYGPRIRESIVIRPRLQEMFREHWENRVEKTDCILGIHVRGTDMRNNLGHPVPAPIQAYLERAMSLLKEKPEITGVFLATDEKNVLECFEKAFEGAKWKFFYHDAFRVWDDGSVKKTGVHETELEVPRPLHRYLLGREVLEDAWCLSRCDYLLCGHSNISNVVLLWNQNRYKKVICIGAHEEICMEGGTDGK